MTKIISIEGNIGSGKSTLITKLKEQLSSHSDVIFIAEPVDIWTSIVDNNNENILAKFYKDQEKYAFPFQMLAYISRLHLIKQSIKTNPNVTILIERSCFTDKNVFAKMLYDMGKIEDVCYKIYLMWFNEFLEDLNFSKIIFVDTNPKLCLQRIEKRNRGGESIIELDYLETCHTYHLNWLLEVNDTNKLTLDGNHEFETEEIVLNNYINQIINFIYC